MRYRSTLVPSWRYSPLIPGVLLLVSCLSYIPMSRGTVVADVPEVLVPIAISAGLVAFSLRLGRAEYSPRQVRRVASWCWRGLLVAALAGVWWVVVPLTRGAPIAGLSDQLLTLLSLGSGAGVVVGTRYGSGANDPGRDERTRVLAETTWVTAGGREAITVAVAETLAELEGVEPEQMDFTLYEYVDPDVFETLADGDTSWQLSFHVESYDVLVSSYGTVTVSESDHANEFRRTVESSDNRQSCGG